MSLRKVRPRWTKKQHDNFEQDIKGFNENYCRDASKGFDTDHWWRTSCFRNSTRKEERRFPAWAEGAAKLSDEEFATQKVSTASTDEQMQWNKERIVEAINDFPIGSVSKQRRSVFG